MYYRKLNISYCDDCGPNTGGYYCQVYRSDDVQIDDFCIHPDELADGAEPEDIIRKYIDDMYPVYQREDLIKVQKSHDLSR